MNLQTCDERLQRLFTEVIKHVDCTVIQGHRGKDEQDEAFRKGHSKLKFPNSKHNSFPSKAVDVAPYPIDWTNRERFTYFAGIVKGLAISMNIPLRWGGDWSRNFDPKDETFLDLPHFEIDE